MSLSDAKIEAPGGDAKRPAPRLSRRRHADDRTMAIEVEVNLRVPSLMLREDGQPDRRVDNSSVRFARRILVDHVPKRDETVSVPSCGTRFECTATRCDWSDAKNVLVVSCVFSRRSITRAEYERLLTDPEWAKLDLPA